MALRLQYQQDKGRATTEMNFPSVQHLVIALYRLGWLEYGYIYHDDRECQERIKVVKYT